jgi:tryptophan halogenase
MLNLRDAKRITVIGGGTAGWFSALTLRKICDARVEVRVIESPTIGIIGVGEGGLVNLITSLNDLGIPIDEFVKETGAAYKLGFAYEGWRDASAADKYFHMFADVRAPAFAWADYGIHPYLSMLVHQQIPLEHAMAGFSVIAAQGSQAQAAQMLADPANGISLSYHFDSHRVAKYLEKMAVARGVVHQQALVEDLIVDERNHVCAIQTNEGLVETDFLIDASGMARLAIGKKFKSEWRSFKDYLLLDRAIPFHMPHPKEQPYLVTRAIAMSAGWMWQIPLIERVGAGYVFSSKHMTEAQAIVEIEKVVGHPIAPQKTISFEPGHFKEVWQGNVMTLGLASGFVEPLEATSIGQMLEQLRQFRLVLADTNGVVSQKNIDNFNQANCAFWDGIRDFLRMHYDCPRRDTRFWRDVAQLPLPESYAQIKHVLAERTPRESDLKTYALHGWQQMFGTISWMMVGAPLGVVSSSNAGQELFGLPQSAQVQLMTYLNQYRAAQQL